jgi:hypothetical protein
MTSPPLTWVSVASHPGARAVVVTVAYLAAAAAVLLTVIVLRGLVPAALLDRFLGFVLIASLAAGLEPGTVKASALGEAGGQATVSPAHLAAGAVKALAASPVLALLWRFADPAVPGSALVWTPILAVAGFCATDLRAGLDLRGRYAMAITVKQGSLAGGFVLAGGLIACGAPLSSAIGVSCLARLTVLGVTVNPVWSGDRREPRRGPSLGTGVLRLLGDRRWIDLAGVSVIAAASGGADRLFGLRYLTPVSYAGYYLTYELFSRFWLAPYLLSPILFARRALGADDDGFARAAWGLTGLAGGAYLIVTAALVVLAPGLLHEVVGLSFGPATLAFAAAVVLNSFSQLRVAELQGAGRSRRAAVAIALGAAVSIPLFFLAARGFGGRGLLLAWLAKSALELAVLTFDVRFVPQKRGDGAATPGR